jgi:predicted phosphodiesterase
VSSDLHLEFKGQQELPPLPEYDVAILAGDIGTGYSGFAWAINHFPIDKPLIYVPGNHEYYGGNYDEIQKGLSSLDWRNVHVLNPGTITINETTFIGATLWSKLKLDGYNEYPHSAYERAISDFQVISSDQGKFSAQKMLEVNSTETQFIENELEKNGKKVVITHFLPSKECIAPFFEGDALNPYFVNEVDHLISKADLWIYGHTHSSMDKKHTSGTRMVCNPRGYPKERKEYFKWKIVEV